MTNAYGLDVSYFKGLLKRLIRDIDNYTPDEFARACTRMATTADDKVLREVEFSTAESKEHKLIKKLAKLERNPSRYSHMSRGNEVYTAESWPDAKVEKLVKKAKKLMGELDCLDPSKD